jgi:dihydrofolate reductase
MQVSIITAFDRNKLIGNNASLPWHLPEDLAYFKKVTLNKTIVMGRKTYESIGKPLPNRRNLVISSQMSATQGIEVINGPDTVFNIAQDSPIFIIGGAQIYEYFLPHASKLYITFIDADFSGNVFFPNITWDEWELSSEVKAPMNEVKDFNHFYRVYARK